MTASIAGPWTLGSKYKWMNPFAVIWTIIITIIFCLPFTPRGRVEHVGATTDVHLGRRQLRADHGRAVLIIGSGIWWLLSAQ